MMHPDEVGPVYRRLRAKLILFAEGRRCADPESVADEALYRAFVQPGFRGREIDNVDAYVFGFAKMVLKEWFRQASRVVPIDEFDTGCDSQPGVETLDIKCALERLPPRDRELLVRFYGHGETAEDLGPRFRLTPAGIRTRVFNLKAVVRRLLTPRPRSKNKQNEPIPRRHIQLEA